MLRVLLTCLALLALASPSRAATVIACQDANGSDYPVSPQNPCAVQGVTGGVPVPTTTSPGTRTEVPLDVAVVTTANTAVTALTAGHRTEGGWIENPPTATTVICVNTIGTAAFSSGNCVGSNNGVMPGVTYNIPPNANAVSVIASDSAHGFSGEGLQ